MNLLGVLWRQTVCFRTSEEDPYVALLISKKSFPQKVQTANNLPQSVFHQSKKWLAYNHYFIRVKWLHSCIFIGLQSLHTEEDKDNTVTFRWTRSRTFNVHLEDVWYVEYGQYEAGTIECDSE